MQTISGLFKFNDIGNPDKMLAVFVDWFKEAVNFYRNI